MNSEKNWYIPLSIANSPSICLSSYHTCFFTALVALKQKFFSIHSYQQMKFLLNYSHLFSYIFIFIQNFSGSHISSNDITMVLSHLYLATYLVVHSYKSQALPNFFIPCPQIHLILRFKNLPES